MDSSVGSNRSPAARKGMEGFVEVEGALEMKVRLIPDKKVELANLESERDALDKKKRLQIS